MILKIKKYGAEMENENITGKLKRWIFFGLTVPLTFAAAIGYGVFKHYHSTEELQIADAKVTGTLVSVRTLVDGKVSEQLFEDGAEVKAGDIIARLEVDVNEETIAQLEDTVALAKQNYEDLKRGQIVKVPVKRVRMIPGTPAAPQTPQTPLPRRPANSSLASLEERANRMQELFEMGAVSKKEMDAAIRAYENAKASSADDSSYSTPSTPAASSALTYIEEIEYVDQWQPTPAPVLQNAENAIKQAELSLNVALQEAQETEVIAPVSGAIYYSAELEKEVTAGNSIAKIGDSNELWLAAEVSQEIFDKVNLGSPVNYTLEGANLSGTVIEKIEPNIKDPTEIENLPQWIPPTAENEHPEFALEVEEKHGDERPNDKYILKFSLPTDFDCKPNSSTNVKIKLFRI